MRNRLLCRGGLIRIVLFICVLSLGINLFFYVQSRYGTYDVTEETLATLKKYDPYGQERGDNQNHQETVTSGGPVRRPQQASTSDDVTDNDPTSVELTSETETSTPSPSRNCDLCPIDPPNLIGRLAAMPAKFSPQTLSDFFKELEKGGRYRPRDCIARQRLALIIPYRNRWEHLHVLLHNLIPFLIRQQADVRFFVIEQDPPVRFNRGALLNVGFLEASNLGKFDCYIFHDVDLIPLNDRHLYRCGDQPRHFAVALNKYKYRLLYPEYFGGAVGFTRDQYVAINGNSNLFFGWGGEDDDLYVRTQAKGYDIARAPKQLAKYDMINHSRDKGNEENPVRKKMLRFASKRMDVEGLNTSKYKVNGIRFGSLYTWINVELNETEIFQTAPGYLKKIMTEKLDDYKVNNQTHVTSENISVQVNMAEAASWKQHN